jgi:diguanylate cyclase (GGDEF)-like protein
VPVARNENQLSNVLAEFARTMLTDFPIQAILDRLVDRIVEVLPITAAGVTLIAPDTDPRFVAASDASALRFEKLQTELAEGPCIAAYETGDAVVVADLRDEPRFPRFAPRALEAGLAAVFTFPLCHGDERLGALDLYRDVPGPLDAAAMDAAQTLADVAAAYLLNARARAAQGDALAVSRSTAVHDALTGLPNRTLLLDRLGQTLTRHQRRPSSAAVLFLDVDRFKALNDSLGHAAGDLVLIEVAARLRAALRPADTVARLGGDEFVIVCEDPDHQLQVFALASRLADAVAVPFVLEDQEISLTLSIGIAFGSGASDESADSLLRDADAAMYRAKAAGRNRAEVFDADMRSLAAARAESEDELRAAIDNGELVVRYQPVLSLATNEAVGIEALVRWEHPTRGSLAAGEFIPLAEETGLIVPLGSYVLREACRQAAAWRTKPSTPLLVSLSVNLSGRQLLAPGLVDEVRSALVDSGLAPGNLCLEITEYVLVDDARASRAALEALKAIGVRIAVDDFGTGYASLAYLKEFPVDVLKIDRTFTAGIVRDRHDRVIVSAVVDLARAFGLTTIAEGVETEEQMLMLRSLNCEAAQGFWWSPPLLPDELAAWMVSASVTAAPERVSDGSPVVGVLIVEDDKSVRTMLKLLFDGSPGYTVLGEADDGREAIAAAAHYQPDLVLLDLSMPGMGGLEALPRIREVAPQTRIVVLTGLATPELFDEARASGAAEVIEKGLDPFELLGHVERILGRGSGSGGGVVPDHGGGVAEELLDVPLVHVGRLAGADQPADAQRLDEVGHGSG